MLFDDAICRQANVPNSLYFDTMHNVCASGGFGQYEVNQFCRELRKHHISGEDLAAWVFVHQGSSTRVCEIKQALVFGPHQ